MMERAKAILQRDRNKRLELGHPSGICRGN